MKLRALITDSSPVSLTKAETNEILRKQFSAIGDQWHQKFRPLHFKREAFTRYGYTPRKPGYVRRKLKKGLGNLPLVLTGRSRDLAKTKTIRATRNGVTVTMPVRVFNFRPRNSAVDMRREFTTVSPQEITDIERATEKRVEQELNRSRPPRRTRIT